jgi:transcriptional regulator with XRE-family HTH domain
MPRAFHSPEYRRFVALLVEQRQAAQLTQAEVAARLGKSQSFVAKYERGERRIDVVEFLRISRAIGFDPSEVIRRLARP